MYSGLLPKGLTENDLSSGDEEDEQEIGVEEKKSEEEQSQSSAGTYSTSLGDALSTPDACNAQGDSPRCSMPGISQEMWQKFQDLRKKNNELKAMKFPRKRKRRQPKKDGTGSGEPTKTSRVCQGEQEKPWDGLKQYFGVNDRFDPPACSKPPPKSGLEKSIEKAIAEGDIAKAEEMSDRLATRELGVKIAQAADCRDFVQRKQEEEALRKAQKRKKEIIWGFEAKQRWESKSNMGYM